MGCGAPPQVTVQVLDSNGLVVYFGSQVTVTTPGATIVSEHWDWGDGSSSDGAAFLSHTFAHPGPFTVTVTVTDSDGLTGSTSVTVTVTAPPVVTAIAPSFGPESGGTPVTISGSGFGMTQVTSINFGTVPAPSFQQPSTSALIATAPPGAGTVDITVTTTSGTSLPVSTDRFTYVGVPIVASVAPASGPSSGGTSVTISGTNLEGAGAVDFGSAPAVVTSDSPTEIVATAPLGAHTVNVIVHNASGPSAISIGDRFTYLAPPTLSSVTPTSGPSAGGTRVTLRGTGFLGTLHVTFGGRSSTRFTVSPTGTSIVAYTPSAPAGRVSVAVTTPDGTTPASSPIRYAYLAPVISGLRPASGPASGGTTVRITGAGLQIVTGVRFGSKAATSFHVNPSGTVITATTPAESARTVHPSVTTPFGSVTAPSSVSFRFG